MASPRGIDELGPADDEAGLAAERGEQHGDAVAVTHLLQDDGLKTAEREPHRKVPVVQGVPAPSVA